MDKEKNSEILTLDLLINKLKNSPEELKELANKLLAIGNDTIGIYFEWYEDHGSSEAEEEDKRYANLSIFQRLMIDGLILRAKPYMSGVDEYALAKYVKFFFSLQNLFIHKTKQEVIDNFDIKDCIFSNPIKYKNCNSYSSAPTNSSDPYDLNYIDDILMSLVFSKEITNNRNSISKKKIKEKINQWDLDMLSHSVGEYENRQRILESYENLKKIINENVEVFTKIERYIENAREELWYSDFFCLDKETVKEAIRDCKEKILFALKSAESPIIDETFLALKKRLEILGFEISEEGVKIIEKLTKDRKKKGGPKCSPLTIMTRRIYMCHHYQGENYVKYSKDEIIEDIEDKIFQNKNLIKFLGLEDLGRKDNIKSIKKKLRDWQDTGYFNKNKHDYLHPSKKKKLTRKSKK